MLPNTSFIYVSYIYALRYNKTEVSIFQFALKVAGKISKIKVSVTFLFQAKLAPTIFR